MNESESNLVKKCSFDNPPCCELDSVLDSCFKDCHNKYFHKGKYECIYDIKFKNIAINGMIDFTVSGKNMDLFELNKKLNKMLGKEVLYLYIYI